MNIVEVAVLHIEVGQRRIIKTRDEHVVELLFGFEKVAARELTFLGAHETNDANEHGPHFVI